MQQKYLNKKNGLNKRFFSLSLLIPLLLISCNNGTSNGSESPSANALVTTKMDIKIEIPDNCAEDDINNPTVETCFYIPTSNGSNGGELNIPSYTQYVSIVGAGGGGGGGGASAETGSVYNGGGSSGTNGENALILISSTAFSNMGSLTTKIGGGGGETVVLINNGIIFSAPGGNGGNGGNSTGDYGLGGTGSSETKFLYYLFETNSLLYSETYQNGGKSSVCNQSADSCDANSGGSGFAIVTFSKDPVTENIDASGISQFNFRSPSQNNICMLIRDNSNNQDPTKKTIEVACSNNGHPVYIKTIAHAGSILSATDDGSVIKITNPTQAKVFMSPSIKTVDNYMVKKFDYEPTLQEERFAVGNNQYKTTKITVMGSYDSTDQTKMTSTSTLAPSGSVCSLVHGNLSCGAKGSTIDSTNLVHGLGFILPRGDWMSQCHGSNYDGVVLTANCGGIEQTQYATPGDNSSCTIEDGSLTCVDSGFSYPSMPSGLYPYWNKWSFKKDHFGGDILLSATSEMSGGTSTTIAASGSGSVCSVVGANNFISCDPYMLPGGTWVNNSKITSASYDGYNLTATVRTGVGVGSTTVSVQVSPDLNSQCSYDGTRISCN